MDIQTYADSIPDFDNLTSGQKIKYFVYFVEKELQKEASIKDILQCYDQVRSVPYSNISMYLKNNSKIFIRSKKGYKLERTQLASIEKEIAESRKEGFDIKSAEKIIISHASLDKEYGQALVNLLRGIGLQKNQIIFSSSDLYGIPLGEDIFEYLRNNIDDNIFVIFLLSDNYYESVACQNEMGAVWIAQNDYEIIGIPGFDFSSSKFRESCINTRRCGMLLDNWVRIAEFKEKLKKKFGLTIDDLEWQDLIEKYKDEIKRIKLK